jgi:hypothetical protein
MRRREQCRRARRRIPLPLVTPPTADEQVTTPVPVAAAAAAATPTAPVSSREGQRPASFCGDGEMRGCQRPGCYAWFVVASASSPQRFCSCWCRRALRTVLDREARWRYRRRAGYRPRRRRARPPPAVPP